MKIFLAKDAGYCFGVRDAVNLAYDTADTHGEVYMLGTVVHNERVVSNLEKVGTKVVKSLPLPCSNLLLKLGLCTSNILYIPPRLIQ